MKALVIYKDGITKVEDVPTPEVTADTIRIKVKACGVCGSDIPRVLNNKAHYYPIILGHEFSGIVDGIGKSVDNVKVGDHVVGVPLIPCHDCEDCITQPKGKDGTFCQHLIVRIPKKARVLSCQNLRCTRCLYP